MVRHGLRNLLSIYPDFEIVGEAEDGSQVLPLLAEHETDVILLDIQMRGQDGIEIARQVCRSFPEVKIIILTTFDDESYLRGALEAGIDGYLLKNVAHENLPDAIRTVMRREQDSTIRSGPASRPRDEAELEDGASVD